MRKPNIRSTSRVLFGLAVVLLANFQADAGDILRGGAGLTNGAGSTYYGGNQAAVAQLQQNAKDLLARTTNALQAAQAIQQAAHNLALRGPNNLGTDPLHPGLTLPNVPNGLANGGLQIASGSNAYWQGASQPVQSIVNGQTLVTIQQTAPQAILNWQTFNVGKNTTAYFNQSAGGSSAHTWVALNRVLNPLGVPSQILGNIKAEGQVYLINSNGIIFGGSSQVNVSTLVASTAGITNDQFTGNGIYSIQTNGSYVASFSGSLSPLIVQPGAEITTISVSSVLSRGGSVILLGSSVENSGSIATANGQTILGSGKNFYLRQGYSVSASNTGALGGNQTSTTLGTEIEVDNGGATTNAGLITATTGDITLVGGQVTQSGVAISTSSIAQRGTIHLLTSMADPTTSVTLTPGSLTVIAPELNSGTALNSQRAAALATETAYLGDTGFNDEANLPDRGGISRIEITTGGTVDFQSDSLTLTNGGQIAVSAGEIPQATGGPGQGGRIYVATGAQLDVSGLVGVTLPMSANDLPVNIQGFELRDAPTNRDTKVLNNNTVYVDIRNLQLVPGSSAYNQDRYYTPGGLLEVSGELNDVNSSISQWDTVGGCITLSGNEVVAQPGSIFNIAGGSIQYQSGYLKQSYLIGSDGRIYNVNTAPAGLTYVGVFQGFIVNHPRWNVTERYDNAITEPEQVYQTGYVVGRDAGSLLIFAPSSVFEGTIEAGTITGSTQDTSRPANVSDPLLLPQKTVPFNGTLTVGPYNGQLPVPNSTPQQVLPYSSNVIFDDNLASTAATLGPATPLPANVVNTNTFSPSQISRFGLGGLTINVTAPVAGQVENTAQGWLILDGAITLASGAQVNIQAATAVIAGGITARGGSVAITTGPVLPEVAGQIGIVLQSNSTIDTRGLWTNAYLDPSNVTNEAYLNGGNVTLTSDQGIALNTGSLIDASSGGAFLAPGKSMQGTGGNISIQADSGFVAQAVESPVILSGTLRSIGLKNGGALTIQAYSVMISDQPGVLSTDQIWLPPSFFDHGFSSYTINGLTSLTVAPGSVINVTEPVYQITQASSSAPSGSDPAAAFGNPVLLPVYSQNPVTAKLTQRPGASVTLQSGINASILPDNLPPLGAPPNFAVGGTINFGKGAVVNVDPGQSVNIQSLGQITFDGIIHAPSGFISIVDNRLLGGLAPTYNPGGLSVWIGSDSVLDVAAKAVTALDQFGRPYGVVPDGGSIVLGNLGGINSFYSTRISTDAFVIVRAGAILNASGASAVIDPTAGTNEQLNGPAGQSNSVLAASNGGSITMTSYDGVYNDGTMYAAGGPGAAGGTFALYLESPVYSFGSTQVPESDVAVPRIITVSQVGASGLSNALLPGQIDPTLQIGKANVNTNAIDASGFSNVILYSGNAISFAGNVTLKTNESVELAAVSLAETDANGAAKVVSPYVLLTSPAINANPTGTSPPTTYVPTSGPGLITGTASLVIQADLIDFKNATSFGLSATVPQSDGTTVQFNEPAFSLVSFVSQGDIRFLAADQNGTTTIGSPGNISFTAAQIYPETGVSATVIVGLLNSSYTPGTSISIYRINSSTPAVPDSVFGNLTFEAGVINQGGIVRAPLGTLSFGTTAFNFGTNVGTVTVNFLPGSLTSVSANGLTIPYGGTTDGVNYLVNGNSITPPSLIQGIFGNSTLSEGISISSVSISAAQGAAFDLSGGGVLTGAGFISGRGGSVNVLTTALANQNPSNTYSSSSDPVYAIVPGVQSYAPPGIGANTTYGGSVPMVGQQIAVPVGVPGLPAGTYTLMPSTYALLPGAFRVELNPAANSNLAGPAVPLGNGSYEIDIYKGVANTGIRSALPSVAIITPGSAVRTYSQYDEEGYSSFAINSAARLGNLRPFLPEDAKTMQLNLAAPQNPASGLVFDGSTNFSPAGSGVSGALVITGNNNTGSGIEITAPGATPTAGWVSISSAAIDAIAAPNVFLGGGFSVQSGVLVTAQGTPLAVVVRSGAILTGAQVILAAGGDVTGGVTIEAGATINTLAGGIPDLDSSSGYIFSNVNASQNTNSIIVVSNGFWNFAPSSLNTGSPLTVSDGASLYSDGSIVFATSGSLSLGENVNYGAREIAFSAANIDIGTAQTLAVAAQTNTLPAGLLLDQAVLSSLLKGNPQVGAPALQTLILSASQSINFYGSVNLTTIDAATGKSTLQTLELETPAVYGAGGPGDTASITTGTLYWNGLAQIGLNPADTQLPTYTDTPPGPVIPNGPGTGSGSSKIVADQIVFGYSPIEQAQNVTALNRLVLGFSSVDLTANQEITANNKGGFSVYQSQGTTAGSYTGGNLNLITPMLTGGSGSVMTYKTGGTLTLSLPAGSLSGTSNTLGAEIDLIGSTIIDSGTIAAASGKVSFSSTGDIALTSSSRIDVSGRVVPMFDQTVATWGGDVVLESAQGNITQAAGSVIDVTAVANNAGSLTLTATGTSGGGVTLNGTLLGNSTGSYNSGSFDVQAQNVGDFTGLNQLLDSGGFFYSRSFDIKQGDITINAGTTIRAQNVTISVDTGSLTINGIIDASGATPGSIRLSAQNNLTLGGTSVLDVHSMVLRVDSYGQPIEAANKGVVELTAQQGTLSLAQGSTFNLSSPDGIARGEINLNAPRTGETSGDIQISAGGPVIIVGAASVAVNAFWKYSPTDSNGTVVQDNGSTNPIASNGSVGLVQIDQRSQLFITTAWANSNLQARLAGLKAYGSAFHLRPGVEIDSSTPGGNLTVSGDLNLSGFRYGPNATGNGAGEPGVLILRAGGNLNVYGSINDGFGNLTPTPDDNGWVLQSGAVQASVTLPGTLPQPVTLNAAQTTYPAGDYSLSYPLPVADGASILGGFLIPVTVTLNSPAQIQGTFVATGTIQIPGGPTYSAGQVVSANNFPGGVLPVGTTIGPGNVLPFSVQIDHVYWPAGVSLAAFNANGNTQLNLYADPTKPFTLTAGDFIPSGAQIAFADGSASEPLRPQNTGGTQGVIYPLEQMLPSGSLSWSLRLVSGADLSAADSRVLVPSSLLNGQGNLVLDDPHFTLTPNIPAFSVIRTGTGDLELLAGGNFVAESLYGIYTAGTQVSGVTAGYNLARGDIGQLTANYPTYATAVAGYQAYYPDHGGNVLVSAQGDITTVAYDGFGAGDPASYSIGNWLWRQGGTALGQLGAWWINFGTYADYVGTQQLVLTGFTGIGALGGGNVTVVAGGNAGVISPSVNLFAGVGENLTIAVGATGRVGSDGSLTETGGGNITVKIGEALNPVQAGLTATNGFSGGEFTDVRGNISLQAGSIGGISLVYGQASSTDPRSPNPVSANLYSYTYGGPVIAPGDGSVVLQTRGDLVIGNAADPGRVTETGSTQANVGSLNGSGASWFTLWSSSTSIDAESAGGNLVPFSPGAIEDGTSESVNSNLQVSIYSSYIYPPILRIVTAAGSIYFGSASAGTALELAPSSQGHLDVLAYNSIYANALDGFSLPTSPLILDISGANPGGNSIPNPFSPAFYLYDPTTSSLFLTVLAYNTSLNANQTVNPGSGTAQDSGPLFAFEPDNATGLLHSGDNLTSHIFALTGDIVDLQFGEYRSVQTFSATGTANSPVNWVIGAQQAEVRAGNDIVNFGQTNGAMVGRYPSLLVNNSPNSVSVVWAGKDILFANIDIAGPGLLEVGANGNIYQGAQGVLESLGPIGASKAQNPTGGAGITVFAGVGAYGPDWSNFANLYLNPANLANPTVLLANQPGKVLETYQDQLDTWLQQRFGYQGTQTEALTFFEQLPVDQQSVFLLEVYFSELNQSGLEYNDPNSQFYHTYVRGDAAIAALFPSVGPNGQKITYSGGLTMFSSDISGTVSDSSILTDLGGTITMVVPGGQTTVGVDGVTPGSHAGILTEGSGDINIYSEGSVLLGQSRILTTFGGNLLIWSATGDINAGIGAKGTVIFTPPGINYDDNYANISLSPTVPSSGAGIGTLAPIPSVPPGNLNLVAPEGTIDAGEAGIRASGNANLAARVIVNAANITVAGKVTGIPTIVSPNVSAITAANSTAGAATSAAQEIAKQQANTAPTGEVPSLITVEVLGYGGDGE
jgi:filamentous hemagglutinin family protein